MQQAFNVENKNEKRDRATLMNTFGGKERIKRFSTP